jgi:hemoglobin-like flavoprotein
MSLNIDILESTFDYIKPQARNFASSFYANLFAEYPQTRPLFANSNMEQQQQKLMMSLAYVIENLRHPQLWQNELKELGEKHVEYGVIQTHYPMVGAALLKTLESYLGQRWTPEVKQAWADAYGAIIGLMLEGAEYPEEVSKKVNSWQSAKPTTKKNFKFSFKAIARSRSLNLKLMRVLVGVGVLVVGFLLGVLVVLFVGFLLGVLPS